MVRIECVISGIHLLILSSQQNSEAYIILMNQIEPELCSLDSLSEPDLVCENSFLSPFLLTI